MHLAEIRTCWSSRVRGEAGRREKQENDNYLRVIGVRIVVPPGKRANKENSRNCISSFSSAQGWEVTGQVSSQKIQRTIKESGSPVAPTDYLLQAGASSPAGQHKHQLSG